MIVGLVLFGCVFFLSVGLTVAILKLWNLIGISSILCCIRAIYSWRRSKIMVLQLDCYENCVRTGEDGNRPHVLQENLTYHNIAFHPGALYDQFDQSKFFLWASQRDSGVRGLLSKDYKGKEGDKWSINHKTSRG